MARDLESIYRKSFFIFNNKCKQCRRPIVIVIHRFAIEGVKTEISKVDETLSHFIEEHGLFRNH